MARTPDAQIDIGWSQGVGSFTPFEEGRLVRYLVEAWPWNEPNDSGCTGRLKIFTLNEVDGSELAQA